MKRHLVVTAGPMNKVLSHFIEEIESMGWTVLSAVPKGQGFNFQELLGVSAGADAMIIGDDEASREFFQGVGGRLSLLVKWGIGTDSIDFDAACEAGVAVQNTPGVFGSEIADLAMGYVLSLARHIVQVHNAVKNNEWVKPQGISLDGKTLSIVGLGDGGGNLAKRAEAFGMTVKYHDPFVDNPRYESCPIEEVFSSGDFVVLTCPSTDQTRGIASISNLSLMKKGAFLVNVARGDLVVEEDLAHVLRTGHLAGAALDVFQVEPLPEDSTLRNYENVIFGAHNASNTRDALLRATGKAVEILRNWTRKVEESR
jgi:D-3-phosphoglycerate dehydrogenase